ncbi:hypothetical protein [Ruixingdingia sedimenti]|uniref:Uncharacterized protein n=1 Tax=Ruixingdingia sedimenti TaxID=3073604 RepID=A0ABU1FDD6_9RHOB|nr:hypothetical protein [Xinfangfangia sp. LG-4]MDR5654897.1 hypothetical protein [Xinfangfangia sp. LG-4]
MTEQLSKGSRHKRRRTEAKKMVAIFKRIGGDNPPSAHEVMKMEAWKATRPSQLPRFERETRTGRYAGSKP